MTSNANTSGLEVVARVYNTIGGEPKAIMEQHDRFMSGEPLVTAASAQARIAELQAERDDLKLSLATLTGNHSATVSMLESMREADLRHLLERDAAEARADRLAKFGQHINWELSFCYLDDEEGDPGCWTVHSVNGGRNDREWTVIGRGETPDAAIQAALQQEPTT